MFAIPVGIVLFSPNYSTLREVRLLTQLFLLPPLAYVLYLLFSALIKKNPDALPLLLGFSPMVITALLDIFLHEVMKLYNFPYLSGFGWQMVLISFLFLLAGRFARARNEAEDLNAHLENKVRERTEELSMANMQLQQANSALEEANYRAQRDLKMAEFVQKSFYPAVLPTLNGWDVAYAFEPMSGVSGDLYDFYIDENTLLGAGLFDVSGHGIASGLVAMLAKSIVYRQFKDSRDIPLGEVMKKINEKLISEKGNIENYLTGILLRFTDDRVEYVNAGHPDLLYRSSRTGLVKAVESRRGESRGRFIGLEGLSEGYRSLRSPGLHSAKAQSLPFRRAPKDDLTMLGLNYCIHDCPIYFFIIDNKNILHINIPDQLNNRIRAFRFDSMNTSKYRFSFCKATSILSPINKFLNALHLGFHNYRMNILDIVDTFKY